MYKMLPFYKPNGRGTGTALQVTRTQRGLLFAVAKQKTVAQGPDDNATFDWENNTIFTFDTSEMTQVIAFFTKHTFAFAPRQPGDIKFNHGKSSTPKTITVKYQEYPVASGQWNFQITVAESEADEAGQKLLVNVALKDHEMMSIKYIMEKQIMDELTMEGNLATILGTDGVQILKNVEMPTLNIGETIKHVKDRNPIFYTIVNKYYDIKENKMTYMVKESN